MEMPHGDRNGKCKNNTCLYLSIHPPISSISINLPTYLYMPISACLFYIFLASIYLHRYNYRLSLSVPLSVSLSLAPSIRMQCSISLFSICFSLSLFIQFPVLRYPSYRSVFLCLFISISASSFPLVRTFSFVFCIGCSSCFLSSAAFFYTCLVPHFLSSVVPHLYNRSSRV